MIIDINNRTKSRVNQAKLTVVIKKFLLSRRLADQEVSLVLIGDKLMRRLNRATRGLDKITDVLSFRETDTAQMRPKFLGEIFIDCQQIKRQAKIFKTDINQELIFILVHGLLHLVGYNDQTVKEAKIMETMAKKFIAKL